MLIACTASLALWFGVFADDFPEDIEAAAKAATVRVDFGSGVIIGRDNETYYILTAAHCVGPRGIVKVTTFAGSPVLKPDRVYDLAEVVARNKESDIALVRVVSRDKLPEVIQVCPKSAVPRQKVRVLTVGCNKGPPNCYVDEVREREVVLRKYGSKTIAFWESGVPPAPGRSGGPIIDAEKRVLGVCCAGNDEKGVWKGYYCHIDEIHKFLEQNQFKWLMEKKETDK